MIENKMPPKPAADAGMTNLIFCEDFDSFDKVDIEGTGKPGFNWYCDRPFGLPDITRDEMEIKDSVLYLCPEKCGSAIGLHSYSKRGDTGFTYHYGYAEARMRFDPPTGTFNGVPAFWGWCKEDILGRPWDNNNVAGELDILEAVVPNDYGDIYAGAAKGSAATRMIHTGSLHERRRRPEPIILPSGKKSGEFPTCSNWVVNCGYLDQWHYLDSEWHTYAALWEEGYIAWYVDGRKMHAASFKDGELPQYYFRDDPTPLPKHEWSKNNYEGGYTVFNKQPLVLILGCNKNWPMEVDWVRVWQK